MEPHDNYLDPRMGIVKWVATSLRPPHLNFYETLIICCGSAIHYFAPAFILVIGVCEVLTLKVPKWVIVGALSMTLYAIYVLIEAWKIQRQETWWLFLFEGDCISDLEKK